MGEAKVHLEGKQVGAEAIISARCEGLKAEAMIKVISKREPANGSSPKKDRGGLFSGVEFDSAAEPRQRVKFDRSNAKIIIATKAPSVSAYCDSQDNFSGDTPQGQVLLAELVAEAVCSEIARRGVESGTYISAYGAEADAVRRAHIDLQNKYTHKIHEYFVDPGHRHADGSATPRKGRPSRESQLKNAVIEV